MLLLAHTTTTPRASLFHDQDDLHRNMLLRNLLLQFYGECGMLDATHALFIQWSHDVYSYNFMISALAQTKRHMKILNIFYQMLHEAVCPDRVTYAAMFSVFALVSRIEEGRFLHACLIHCLQLSVATAIIFMYGKLGSLSDAQLAFHHICEPDVVAWNCILRVHTDKQNTQEALALYGRMKLEGVAPDQVTFISLLSAFGCISDLHVVQEIHFELVCIGMDAHIKVMNALLNIYAKLDSIETANAIFAKMPDKSVTSWNIMIGVHSRRNEKEKSLHFYYRMSEEGFKPDKVTFINVLPAYFPQDALRLFDSIIDVDVVLWNALLSSFCFHRKSCQAVQIFYQMQEEGVLPNGNTFMIIMSMCSSEYMLSIGKRMHAVAANRLKDDITTSNSLLNMYGKCSSMGYAQNIFNSLFDRTVVTWTIMLTNLTRHYGFAEALLCFSRMVLEGILPDRFVLATVLDACLGIVSLNMGMYIHVQILGTGSKLDAVMGTALLNMYGGCGCLRAVEDVYDQTHGKNTICCNAAIMALAHHGQAHNAFDLFELMLANDIAVDSSTFLGLITACSHGGLIDTGIFFFHLMQITYSLYPTDAHLDCIVDLFGRSGQVKESLAFIDNFHGNPTVLTYRTLLSTCCRTPNAFSAWAAYRALTLEPDDEGCFFLLVNASTKYSCDYLFSEDIE
ncbi:hypothetical protein KP509_09G080500 [Ceratopteris richardii]|uniref:Pentatricopeptide repeat-containing protein n=1 Tax=Ceratopteris richardii TaxID=49495 RepID=A0A8T2UC48_CERRI|nr:hypothetical protein KP509_09G080500 [Ceratopteris richardii]